MQRSLFIAAYDVREPARLKRALKVTKQYACGGQKSAYECWLDNSERQQILSDMAAVLEPEDSFALIPLDPRRGVIALGVAMPATDPQFFYFG